MLGSLRTRSTRLCPPAARAALALAVLLFAAAPAPAAVPVTPETRARIVGQPVALLVQPEAISLVGPRSTVQPVITGRYSDGSLRDLTHFCDVSLEKPGVVLLDEERFLLPLKAGTTTLVVRAAGQTVRVPVTVKDFRRPQPVSFRHELIAALNVGGCNQGACHGTPSGKNGFKLSLRGYDPAADYLQLTRDMLGRRTDRQDPDISLIYQKAL